MVRLAVVAEDGPASLRSHIGDTAMSGPMKRLLVVDDEYELTWLLAAAFRQRHYDVETASTGAGALALVERFNPDAVLLDVMMPEMDGWQVLSRLRRDRRTAHLPVVVMSAAMDARHPLLARQAGATFLEKPFDLARVVRTVESLLAEPGNSAAP